MISGDLVVIKGITKDSAKDIYNWVNKEELREFTGTIYPVSEYEHDEWIKNQFSYNNRKLFLICDKSNDKNIGTIGIKNIDWINRNAEIFISIGDYPQNGSGYGAEAVKLIISFCFNHINLHKVYLHVFESNLRAINCYKKIGMVQEGILIDHHYNNGKYENVLIMSLLNSNGI